MIKNTFKYCLSLLLLISTSCYTDNECKPDYVGKFSIDTGIIANPKCKSYVKKFRWDTVLLISNSNGNYSFYPSDKLWKECEGSWWTSSNDIEGNCFGHIKQNNLRRDILATPFDIFVKISNESYALPFRKIDTAHISSTTLLP